VCFLCISHCIYHYTNSHHSLNYYLIYIVPSFISRLVNNLHAYRQLISAILSKCWVSRRLQQQATNQTLNLFNTHHTHTHTSKFFLRSTGTTTRSSVARDWHRRRHDEQRADYRAAARQCALARRRAGISRQTRGRCVDVNSTTTINHCCDLPRPTSN
jgi:hypothetical protein